MKTFSEYIEETNNKETFEYDINLITHDKYGMNKNKFEFDESNTDIIIEVKGKYVKQIK